MYTFIIDDTSNIMEPRGASRKRIDDALDESRVSDREFNVDQRAVEAAAAKDSMFGGASYE